MGVEVGGGVGSLSALCTVAGVLGCSSRSPSLMMRSHPEGDGVDPVSPAGSRRGGGWNGCSGVAMPSRRSPMGVETDEGVAAPELLVEADWGGVYIGTFSITHNGLLRAKRFFNDATCDAVLVPTNFANSLLNFHPTFVTASLKRSTSSSVHLFPPFFFLALCDGEVSGIFDPAREQADLYHIFWDPEMADATQSSSLGMHTSFQYEVCAAPGYYQGTSYPGCPQ